MLVEGQVSWVRLTDIGLTKGECKGKEIELSLDLNQRLLTVFLTDFGSWGEEGIIDRKVSYNLDQTFQNFMTQFIALSKQVFFIMWVWFHLDWNGLYNF